MKNIKIEIPQSLLEYTEQTSLIELVSINVGEALLLLCNNYPLLTSHLIDQQGKIIKDLSISINQINMDKMQSLNTLLKENDLISIHFPA